MERLDFASIPAIIATHAQTGARVEHEKAMTTAALARLLGLEGP